MKEIIPFQYQHHEIRVQVDDDGNPWWIAKDVCNALEFSNYRDVVTRLDDDEKGVGKVDTLGGEQDMILINESGLYNLVLRSNKPQAKPFRKWVTSEVLPSIRKTGSYTHQSAAGARIAEQHRLQAYFYARESELKDQLLDAKNDTIAAQADLLVVKDQIIEIQQKQKTAKLLHIRTRWPKAQLTKAERAAIIQLKREGKRNCDIARLTRRSKTTIRGILQKEGFPPEGPYYPKKSTAPEAAHDR